MNKDSKIYVAGHRGMVGSAIVRELQRQGYNNIVTRTHAELDLTRQEAVEAFFAAEKPEYVFLAAAKVGGIAANNAANSVVSSAAKCSKTSAATRKTKAEQLLDCGS
jgi:GDP-L-fucose synthase